MKNKTLFILLLFLAVPLQTAIAFDSYRAGSHVIRTNDAVAMLEEYMGQPDRKEPVENWLGAHIGDYYFYQVDSKTVRFLIRDGLVVEIQEFR